MCGVIAGIVAAAPQPGSAHTEVVSVRPPDGARLADPPRQVVVTYSEPLGRTGSASLVTRRGAWTSFRASAAATHGASPSRSGR